MAMEATEIARFLDGRDLLGRTDREGAGAAHEAAPVGAPAASACAPSSSLSTSLAPS